LISLTEEFKLLALPPPDMKDFSKYEVALPSKENDKDFGK
jgi:hypothetical protein